MKNLYDHSKKDQESKSVANENDSSRIEKRINTLSPPQVPFQLKSNSKDADEEKLNEADQKLQLDFSSSGDDDQFPNDDGDIQLKGDSEKTGAGGRGETRKGARRAAEEAV